MVSPCRLQPGELVAYRDGTLPEGRREIVEAHLAACRHCQERLAAFDEVDRIIQEKAVATEFSEQRRAALRAELRRESNRQADRAGYLKFLPMPQSLVARLLVVLLVLLAALPPATQAGFPLGRIVHFAEVEIKEALPLDAQKPIQHVAPSAPSITEASFPSVAPAELPLGLVRVEQSIPGPDRTELVYRNQSGIAILVTELPAATGMVTQERTGTDLLVVRGVEVLIANDPRPDAVAALFWERGGVFFDVMVIEAPLGKHGGLKQADALEVVEALMAAQDVSDE